MPRVTAKRSKPANLAERLPVRMLARTGAIGFVVLTIGYGLMAGGHLDDPRSAGYGLPGEIAGYFGYAARDIHISGLKHQKSGSVLKAIGVVPDGPLIGFSTRRAKRLLENIDWVASANLRRVHPNGLEIEVVEREPFAVWQRDSVRYVIDKGGAALSTLDPDAYKGLLLVTGEGAQSSVAELVNHMEGHPGIKSRVNAAARVGKRRWTLYLDHGLRVALAEKNVAGGLARLVELNEQEGVFDKAVELIDLRFPGRTIVRLKPEPEGEQVAQVNQREGG